MASVDVGTAHRPMPGSSLRRLAVFAAAGLGFAAWSSLSAWSERHALLVNRSTSLPNWAFIIDRQGMPRRGDRIFFVPPKSPLLERHFGRGSEPFGKIVYGVAGDRVERRGRLFVVAGRPVGIAKPVSLRGEPLAAGPTGIIPRGCYFAGTPNKDSFDSRYALIGWVCRQQVVGTGEPVL